VHPFGLSQKGRLKRYDLETIYGPERLTKAAPALLFLSQSQTASPGLQEQYF
jgi:hypothetical protein